MWQQMVWHSKTDHIGENWCKDYTEGNDKYSLMVQDRSDSELDVEKGQPQAGDHLASHWEAWWKNSVHPAAPQMVENAQRLDVDHGQ